MEKPRVKGTPSDHLFELSIEDPASDEVMPRILTVSLENNW